MPCPGSRGRALARSVFTAVRSRFAGAKEAAAIVEVDEIFTSLNAWLDWSQIHPGVYDAKEAANIADCILRAGFQEPLTGRAVTPHDISAPDTNWREGLAANGLNSRHRAVLALIAEATAGRPASEVRIFAT